MATAEKIEGTEGNAGLQSQQAETSVSWGEEGCDQGFDSSCWVSPGPRHDLAALAPQPGQVP